MQRPGEGQGCCPTPHALPTKWWEEHGDNASPGPLPPLPRRAGPPKECREAPFCTPAPTRSSGGREGRCWGGAVAGSPSALPWAPQSGQRLQVDAPAQHPEHTARAFCKQAPAPLAARDMLLQEAPPSPPASSAPRAPSAVPRHTWSHSGRHHPDRLWAQAGGQGTARAIKQTGQVSDGERGVAGQGAGAAQRVEKWVPEGFGTNSAETQAWGTLTLPLPESPQHFTLDTSCPGRG